MYLGNGANGVKWVLACGSLPERRTSREIPIQRRQITVNDLKLWKMVAYI